MSIYLEMKYLFDLFEWFLEFEFSVWLLDSWFYQKEYEFVWWFFRKMQLGSNGNLMFVVKIFMENWDDL